MILSVLCDCSFAAGAGIRVFNRTRALHKRHTCTILTIMIQAQATATNNTADTVRGVHVACQKKGGGVWDVDNVNDHAMYDHELIRVPAIMYIPLFVYKIGTQSNEWVDLDCQMVTWSMARYETGLGPPVWQSHIGSCLVVRKDIKSFSVLNFSSVHEYMGVLMDLFSDSVKHIQKRITKKDFEQ
jgi:hypothetical protein